jgi:hypothetical protein
MSNENNQALPDGYRIDLTQPLKEQAWRARLVIVHSGGNHLVGILLHDQLYGTCTFQPSQLQVQQGPNNTLQLRAVSPPLILPWAAMKPVRMTLHNYDYLAHVRDFPEKEREWFYESYAEHFYTKKIELPGGTPIVKQS